MTAEGHFRGRVYGKPGVVDGKFCGLALDEDNQEELTDVRISEWTADLKREWPSIVERVGQTIN